VLSVWGVRKFYFFCLGMSEQEKVWNPCCFNSFDVSVVRHYNDIDVEIMTNESNGVDFFSLSPRFFRMPLSLTHNWKLNETPSFKLVLQYLFGLVLQSTPKLKIENKNSKLLHFTDSRHPKFCKEWKVFGFYVLCHTLILF